MHTLTAANYYDCDFAISNSTLTSVKNLLFGRIPIDPTAAWRFGSLVDAMLTEPEKVDYQRKRLHEKGNWIQIDADEFKKARKMADVFLASQFGSLIHRLAEPQAISVDMEFPVNYLGYYFTIPMRGKWDYRARPIRIGCDFKSTSATTQWEFEDSMDKFDYDRQGAVYLDLERKFIDKIMFYGISKKNFQIFQVPIVRGDSLYTSGLNKYSYLAYRYDSLFSTFFNTKIKANG